MATVNLLYKKKYDITDSISIRIPNVGEIIECEDEYYGAVFAITAMPIDMMVQLDDVGIDFTKINEYELFLLLFESLKGMRCAELIFGELDISGFQPAMDEKDNVVLLNEKTGIVIDKVIYGQIAWVLRKIHNIEKKIQKPGNDEAKKYMIERARIKQRRAAKKKKDSDLEDLIIAMVNAKEFKYDYEGVLDMSIYRFNASVGQVIKRVNYDNLMIGCYAGTVNIKEVSQDDLNWLSNNRRTDK